MAQPIELSNDWRSQMSSTHNVQLFTHLFLIEKTRRDTITLAILMKEYQIKTIGSNISSGIELELSTCPLHPTFLP